MTPQILSNSSREILRKTHQDKQDMNSGCEGPRDEGLDNG